MTRDDPPSRSPSFGSLQASELFCSRCRRAQPVRQHLQLVLPGGNRYELLCAVCGASVGSREDDDPTLFTDTLRPD